MLIDIFTGKVINNDKKCNNCKYNIGYRKTKPYEIWCDKHISYRNKNSTCEYYCFGFNDNE